MSLTNDSNISLEIHKKQNILYDEVDIITSNRRIIKPSDRSYPEVAQTQNNFPQKKIENSTDTIFGVSINNPKPKKIGSVYAFLYINYYPLIIIGPDCKYFL